jgi:DNA gyrase subunit A
MSDLPPDDANNSDSDSDAPDDAEIGDDAGIPGDDADAPEVSDRAPTARVAGEPVPGVEPIEIQEEMERSFLEYAMSVIMSRALPDARDGLKPVHRRILFGMYDMGLQPNRAHVKCARVTGDVMGKYHPHGNTAIYDALVRMAQDFSIRHPLIDGHGNFGSPDDGAAAERYTECRLAPISLQLLDGIDEGTVDFRDNYSGEFSEPTVLPSRFPNLLVNGSQGIAVGMATNIPPHNLGEVIDAVTHLLSHPDATPDELMHFVKGPDFPTGGFILGRQGIIDAYRTGRGSIRVRAKAEIGEYGADKKGKGGKTSVIITELPYQASINSIAGRIKELVESRELEGISSIENFSHGDQTELVIGLKRDANANVVLNNLYKLTPLQTSFGVNMVALVDGVPRTLNLRDALVAYVAHQIEVITRRSEHRLDKARSRAHIVEGLLRALDIIDAIIALIRGSDDRPAAREGLMAEPFSFSDVQANYILDMQLGSLTRLNRLNLATELEKLRAEIAELESILADDGRKRSVIADEMREIKEKFATPRKALITFDPGEMSIEDLVDDKELVLTMTRAGYIKSVEATAFRTQGRGGRGVKGGTLKDEDVVAHVLHTSAHAYLLFFSNTGKVYRLRGHEIPERDRTAKGIPVVNLINLAPDERIQAVIDTRDYETNKYLFFATKQGQVKKTLMSEYDKSRREGFIAISLREGDELVEVMQTNGTEDILMVSRHGMGIRFTNDDEQVRPMGRGTAGVRGMKMRSGDEVVAAAIAGDDAVILIITEAGFGKRTKLSEFSPQGRGGQGVRAIRLVAKRGVVRGAFMVASHDDEVMLISSAGVVIRMPISDIGHAPLGRDAMGVKIMNLDDGDQVASVAVIVTVDDEELITGP